MHILITRLIAALFEYGRHLVHRAHIGSIAEWPMYREW